MLKTEAPDVLVHTRSRKAGHSDPTEGARVNHEPQGQSFGKDVPGKISD